MPILTRDQLYTEQNVPYPRNIFSEWNHKAVFCMSRQTKTEGKIPLADLYVSLTLDDPSEATFVDEVFGDYYFWKVLSNASFFREELELWKEEVEIKRKRKAFKTIIKSAEENWTAAEYVLEEPWKGGPSAAENKSQKAKILATTEEFFQEKQVQEDIERLKEQGILN